MKVLVLIMTMLISAKIEAQIGPPHSFSYESVVHNSQGKPIPYLKIGVQFSILKSSGVGNVQYQEYQVTTTDKAGFFKLAVGTGTIQQGVFDAINWGNDAYYLQVGIDTTGGSNYQTAGVSQLLSVPYALNAITVDSIVNAAPCAFTHSIGELYGGGIIFYLWRDAGVEHGLIASLADLSDSIVWQDGTVPITTNALSFDNGAQNTDTIISVLGAGTYAASICHAYAGGGYTDWYLPAIWELYKLYDQDFLINAVLDYDNDSTTSGFSNLYNNGNFAYYWSSTESSYSTAWQQAFYANLDGNATGKKIFNRVRAVRRF